MQLGVKHTSCAEEPLGGGRVGLLAAASEAEQDISWRFGWPWRHDWIAWNIPKCRVGWELLREMGG